MCFAVAQLKLEILLRATDDCVGLHEPHESLRNNNGDGAADAAAYLAPNPYDDAELHFNMCVH